MNAKPAADPLGNDLTSGSLLRGIFRLAGPMFLSAQLQNLQTLIDLFWVGRLGADAVAALSIGGTILMLLFPFVMGMAVGTVALVARYIGAGRPAEAADTARQSLLISFFVGLLTGFACIPFTRPLCMLLGATPEVAALGVQYLNVSFAGSYTVFVLFTASSTIQGAGNSVIPMLAMVLANLINLILDPLFIYGYGAFPALGLEGAALATVLSQGIAVLYLLYCLHRGKAGLAVHFTSLRVDWEIAGRILRIGMPGGGQMLARSLMALALTRVVAGCGMLALAAYGIGMRFHMIVLMPSFALGNAAATMVGQNLGAARPDRAHRCAWLATGIACAVTAGATLILVAFASPLMRIFTPDPEVIHIGAEYLVIVSFFYLFAAVAVVLSRAMMGAGDSMASMILTIVCLWGIQMPLAIWLSRAMHPPTQGIWWAIAATLTAHGILTGMWFQTGRWKHKRIIE
jgi:putative MATE family efflux protein